MTSDSDKPARHFHFIGICGTAMGSVAVALKERGYEVTGSDENVFPPMSTYLEDHGIQLFSGYSPKNVPAAADTVVVGNAIRRGNPEVEAVLDSKRFYLSLPEVLKNYFLRGRHNLVVTGTHGKTTTTSLLAWILDYAKLEPGYMIGGIPRNFGQGANLRQSEFFVIEGDEYDTAFFDKRSKFVHYLPELVIMNNVEFDHADIFRDLDDVKLSFRRLVNIIPRNGLLLCNADDANCLDLAQHAFSTVVKVGFAEDAEARITGVKHTAEGARFTVGGFEYASPLAGEFNVRNAAMAITAARHYGVSPEVAQAALAGFKSIARRMEVRGEVGGITVIDDFAHHPTAIRETLRALRQRYPDRYIWAVFEPRSNTTRRAVFQHELPAALCEADGVVVAQVARLDQIPAEERLNPEAVVQAIADAGRPAFYEPDVPAIVERLAEHAQPGHLIAVLSNGGFGGIHKLLLERLSQQGAALAK
jgi:UDP-N-acetylmuramate: L-alanyl-gamma-D-glutamyl-meso-diaminopimelate ligase